MPYVRTSAVVIFYRRCISALTFRLYLYLGKRKGKERRPKFL